MAYSEFSLETVTDRFGLDVRLDIGRFAGVPAIEAITPLLQESLAEYVPLALAMNTEKARSELIVMPVLMEVRRQLNADVSIFSGVELNVEKQESLNGYCDFLISLSPQQLMVTAPIVALVEAKNDNLPAAWGQCAAEMIAAQRFNAKRGNEIPQIYGAVTSGTGWMFGVLNGKELVVDLDEYAINEPERICGILVAMVRQTA